MIAQRLRDARKLVYRLKKRQGPFSKAAYHGALASYRLYSSLRGRTGKPDLTSEKLVFRDARAMFVSVPKVATSSLISALKDAKPDFYELDLKTLLRRHKDFAGFFKFAFVRNPWSRAASCYREKIETVHPITQARILHNRRGLEAGMPFEAFAEWLNSPEGSDEVADRHWMSQYRILGFDLAEPVKYDFIGRFERLADDYQKVAELSGLPLPPLPHKLRTQSAEEYKALYNPRTIELIAKRYARDIELFGYNFDNTP